MIGFSLFIAFLVFIANVVGTISGFGLSTIMTPILVLFLPLPETILFVCIIHWFHDVWKLGFFWHGIEWWLFLSFGVPTIIAAFLGSLLVSPAQSTLLSVLLGLFLISSMLIIYVVPKVFIPHNWVTQMIGGALSGFFAGIFGIRGVVRSLFFLSFDLQKATFIGTTGAISILLDSTRFVTYFFIKGIRVAAFPWWTFVVFVATSFLGAYVGYLILGKIPEEKFRLVVAAFLLAVGIKLLITPWL